jgi:class 3 adenylate cyclase
MKFAIFKKFWFRWIVVLFPLMVILFLINDSITSQRFSKAYQRLYLEQFEEQIKAINIAKEERITNLQKDLKSIAENQNIIQFLEEGNQDKLMETLKELTVDFEKKQSILNLPRALINSKFKKNEEQQTGIKGAHALGVYALIDEEGNFISKRGRVQLPRKGFVKDQARDGFSNKWKIFFKKMTEGKNEQFVSYQFLDDENPDLLIESVVTPIFTKDQKRLLGAFVYGMRVQNSINSPIVANGNGDRGSKILSGMIAENQLVSKNIPKSAYDAIIKEVNRLLNADEKMKYQTHVIVNGVKHQLMFRVLNPESPFEQAVQVYLFSLADLHEDLAALKLDLLKVAFGLITILFILIYIVTRGMTKPISKMIKVTELMSEGDYQVQLAEPKSELGTLAKSLNVLACQLRLKEKYQSILNAVTDKQVVDKLLNSELMLKGEEREVSVLFCDIRGFTAMTENLPPREVIEMLNEHMTLMTQLSYQYGGMVDKFVGDLIMVVFGAPQKQPMDVQNAVDCALAMIRERGLLNQSSAYQIEVGIGIATGEVISGCMGSAERLNYTVLGERVNLAARLCGQAGIDQILVDSATAALLNDLYVFEKINHFYAKGFSEAVEAFAVKNK